MICRQRKPLELEFLPIPGDARQAVRLPQDVPVHLLPSGDEPGPELAESVPQAGDAPGCGSGQEILPAGGLHVFFQDQLPVQNLLHGVFFQGGSQPAPL